MKKLSLLITVPRFLVMFTFYFLPYYTIEVIRANLQVIGDVITPISYARPAVLKMPLSLEKPDAIFMLAGLITMAPGTVCLDVSSDCKHMYVHVMFYDKEKTHKEFKELERRIGVLYGE